LFLIAVLAVPLTLADEPPPPGLINGGLEEVSDDGSPSGWFVPKMLVEQGYAVEIDSEHALVGDRAAVIDATNVKPGSNSFGNLMQNFDATPFRGKKVRFRAAVRTAGLSADGRAQLWFRVDRPEKDGRRQTGAFDNMGDRPIRSDEWKHYEIVAQVEDDAENIALGLMVMGKEKAWLDDVTLEEVGAQSSTTASALSSKGSDAPQPFFNKWLALAAIAIALMVASQVTAVPQAVQRFALRFSVGYWVLYSFPMPFSVLTGYIGLDEFYYSLTDKVVRFTASGILGIQRELIPPGGSGDTTFSYVSLFVYFVLAISVALIWSVLDRRKSDYRTTKDLLRSYLRYVLAITMLSYGLAKMGSVMNQFPEPGVDQLMKTYGDSSPMNLVWNWMGASRSYTFFAGLGEAVAALLLIWRRTTVLGALTACGVMANVVMLNFSYDIPVKQYSAHLLFMAVYILLPDIGRLANLLVWHRPAGVLDLAPPYTGSKATKIRYVCKTLLILLGIVIPLGSTIVDEVRQDPSLGAPAFFGAYRVEEFRLDGEVSPPLLEDPIRWKVVTLDRYPWSRDGGPGPTDFLSIRLMDQTRGGGVATISSDETRITLSNGSPSVPLELTVDLVDADHLTLSGSADAGRIEVELRRVDREDFLLVNRGFRWINEYPFNR